MTTCQVDNVDVVAYAGAVGSGVVVAEYLDAFKLSNGNLGNVGKQVVRDVFRIFADSARDVGPDGVDIILINVIAFGLALLLTKELRGTNIFRTVFFMPNLIGGIVLGYIWQILINCILSLASKPLLALNSSAGYWGLIILMCWQQIGYMMIIYIAGLQNVPSDLVEAAEIDGANAWDVLWKIKLPMVMSSVTICVFLTLTNSFKLFDQNLALTGGDPNHSTEMLALNIYQTFYARAGALFKGYGQAKAVIFCILVIAISMLQLKLTKSKEVQQ